jgi:hypothetical protein
VEAVVVVEDVEDMEGEGGFGGRVEIDWRWVLRRKVSLTNGMLENEERSVHGFFRPWWSIPSPISKRMAGHDKFAYS